MSERVGDARSKVIWTRSLTVVSILCGSGAATLFWRTHHQTAPLDVSDERLHQAGYASAAEFQEVSEADGKILKDLGTLSGLDGADFEVVRKILSGQNEAATGRIVMSLKWVSQADQRRRLLAILGDRRIPASERKSWYYVFQDWSESKWDKSIIPFLLGSRNRDVVNIEREVTNNEHQRTSPR